jgi:amino acid transporter
MGQRLAWAIINQRELGTGGLTMILISASGPLTVLVGGLVTTFAVSGNVGTPLAYPVLAAVLGLFSVGYAAMSRLVRSAGGFYPYVALGLGRDWGIAASFVAVVSYSTLQTALYGLLGTVAGDFAADQLGVALPWWVWSAAGLAAVGALGLYGIDLNAKVLATLLALEIGAVLLFDAAALTHPAGGAPSLAGLEPRQLLHPGIGVVFALAVAGYLGFEQGAVYSEETRGTGGTVARATYLTLIVTGGLYTLTAWALTVGAGPHDVVALARDPGAELPGALIGRAFGAPLAALTGALLVTSVFACMLSIHHCVARYAFAMSRDRLLPGRLARTGRHYAAPVAASLAQSGVSAVALAAFAGLGRHPVLDMFAWLSYLSALGVLLLLALTSAAVIGFFARRPGASRWRTRYAPALAIVGLAPIVAATVDTAGSVVGTVLVVLLGTAGLLYAARFRRADPAAYAGVGVNALRTANAGGPLVISGEHPPGSAVHTPRANGRLSRGRRLHALYTVARLWPLWRRVRAAVPEVALLPRYRGPAALRSLARHAPLAALRMPVEILDAYAVLAPWAPPEAWRLAREEAGRRCRPADRPVQVEAAVLAVALRARTGPGAAAPAEHPAQALLPDGLSPSATIAHLVLVGRALRRSPVVRATLRGVTPGR